MAMDEKEYNMITEKVIGTAISVHKELGPGLLESAYEACMVYELAQPGINIKQQKPIPVVYKEVKLDIGYRLDLLVEKSLIVKINAVESRLLIHKAQLITHFKLSGCKLGLLINVNITVHKHGVQRVVYGF